MQKISPLRSSIEAFNKFKALRANKAGKTQKVENRAQTNPFGITFKGNGRKSWNYRPAYNQKQD